MIRLFASLIASGILLTGCAKKERLSVACTSEVIELVEALAEGYEMNGQVRVKISTLPPEAILNQLAADKIDLGIISRPLTAAERLSYPADQFPAQPFARDAILPVVSSEVFGGEVQHMPLGLVGSFLKGEVTSWGQVQGPDRQVTVLDLDAQSPARQFFMEKVFGNPQIQLPAVQKIYPFKSDLQVGIEESDSAISFLPFSWLNEGVKGLSIVTAEGKIFDPTLEHIKRKDHPLARDIIVLRSKIETNAISSFEAYLTTDDAATLIKRSGFIPER